MSSNYKDLLIWQKAMDLTVIIYELVKKLPKSETYALSDQMRRAAVSIPSNIAEGQERNSDKEFIRFLLIALGSRSELETHLQIGCRVGYLTESDIKVPMQLSNEIGRMINTLVSNKSTK